MLARLSDSQLMANVQRGNEAAFEVLFDRHHRGLLSLCGHVLGSQEGEDAVQQTFLSVHTALGKKDGGSLPERPKAWLYTIARNRCISVLRTRAHETLPLDDARGADGSPRIPEVAQHRDDVRQILHDLRRLSTSQREALVLSELGDIKHRDIAKDLDCPPDKVKSLVFQARSVLRDQRDARATSCVQIQQDLAQSRHAHRRALIRSHLATCESCRAYKERLRQSLAPLRASATSSW